MRRGTSIGAAWRGSVAAVLALAGCVAEEPPAGTEAEGALVFAESCAGCHGPGGKGDGPAAPGLRPRPADLTRIAARHGGEFPGDWVMSTINGFHRDAPPGTAMPAFGVGSLGPLVVVERSDGIGTPVPVMLLALEAFLRSIQE